MTLPKHIVEQIEKEAIKYCVSQPSNFSGESHKVEAYIAGATKYAEQVEILENALEKIIGTFELPFPQTKEDAKPITIATRRRAYDVECATTALNKLKAMREKNGSGE